MGKLSEYDEIIWQVFATGVISSVTILYGVIAKDSKIPCDYKILALALGFIILVYSFILTMGYTYKKMKNVAEKERVREVYPRARWVGELILLIIIIIYLKSFWDVSKASLIIPFLILIIFFILSLIANYLPKQREEYKKRDGPKTPTEFLKYYLIG